MNERKQVWATGICLILVALAVRFWEAGLLQNLPIISETGRNVRSSVSIEAFSPHFFESALPFYPEEITLPGFSPEEAESIKVTYNCKVSPNLEALLTRPLEWDLTGPEPTVLILHTHASESYTHKGENYEESSPYRTLDEGYNMLSLGEHVARLLEEQGISVLHDRTLHDYPSYNGSYNHARKAIQRILKEYPTIQLILDLHRDAADSGKGQLRTKATVNGQPSAQLMQVLGTGVGGLGNDHWQENLSLAAKLQILLERQNPGITRPISLRAQRFNQDLHPYTLLVEIGAAGNSHDEALLAAEALAAAIGELKFGTEAARD